MSIFHFQTCETVLQNSTTLFQPPLVMSSNFGTSDDEDNLEAGDAIVSPVDNRCASVNQVSTKMSDLARIAYGVVVAITVTRLTWCTTRRSQSCGCCSRRRKRRRCGRPPTTMMKKSSMTEARERFISDDDVCRLRDRRTIWEAILIDRVYLLLAVRYYFVFKHVQTPKLC